MGTINGQDCRKEGLSMDPKKDEFVVLLRQQLDCQCGLHHFKLRYEDANMESASRGQWCDLWLYSSTDGEYSWKKDRIELNWYSIILLWTSAEPAWPPDYAITMGCGENVVWFDYVDELDEMPFCRKASRWRVSRSLDSQKWTLKHVCYL